MNRLTDNDRNFGPVTIGPWHKTFSAYIESGDDEDPESTLTIACFGWAFRLHIPSWMCKPWKERFVECDWDAETAKRLGRSGYWAIHPRRFGFSLSDMGNGYDFFQIYYGPNTHDSRTTKSWSKHLPWKMWSHVRTSIYKPDGSHFADEEKGKWSEFNELCERCPASYFQFEDYDGVRIIATCKIQEREWHKGEGWFKWLRFFSRPKIQRSLDLWFDKEVGPEKGSWKGGIIGTGADMQPNDTPESAFRRWCEGAHERKGRKYNLTFIGPCAPPPPKPKALNEGKIVATDAKAA